VSARLVVIHESATPWWVPLIVGLSVAVIAALASYYATWRFKKADAERESAFRAVDLVNEAERIAARSHRFSDSAPSVLRLLQDARVRAQPLNSSELDDRFRAAYDFLFMGGLWQPPGVEPVGARRWMEEAVANIREGLVPYLAAPHFLPFRSAIVLPRSFPTLEELQAMPHGADGQELMSALNAWKDARSGVA
jgi:hypothetical protein